MQQITEFLTSFGIEHKFNYDLSKASSFHIGGCAEIAIFPNNEAELTDSLKTLKDNRIRFEIIGNGSNILFSDEGYNGALVFTKNMNSLLCSENKISCGCGAKLSAISNLARDNSLSGLEFAHGIPGSVGGAIVMNAGAFGGEIKDTLISSRSIDLDTFEIISLNNNEHQFEYRTSIYEKNKNLVCISAEFELKYDDLENISDRMRQNATTRREKQPIEYPSCGSFYKRPQGLFAAKLIDDCSLKGFSVGGAKISEKHAGFIINTGNAKSSDVIELANIIEEKVFEEFGVKLEREVKYIF